MEHLVLTIQHGNSSASFQRSVHQRCTNKVIFHWTLDRWKKSLNGGLLSQTAIESRVSLALCESTNIEGDYTPKKRW
ncbi:MAG: hypothetical protein OMM_06448 [Candidatus Magnetoglobus multicellularis str. Araruama]|uniref:Uncharacterized protein n=1 Tax=Candidatus Magnetoglobus multicellularis str. Araruama TaxID=890399 RepID=A0A1V1PH74_9BACT|nr:MAG: hypothetical protein OMM_06448 [Candidatus Magnetoglobus multicellularis str. Araruama]